MPGRPALDVASAPRVLLRDGERTYDVFELVDLDEDILRVRTPLLFEIGEELQLRISTRTPSDVTARVVAHVGSSACVTELEILTVTP
jgi:hypothetical protein